MAEDNVTILCDGYWRREFLKPEAERNWDHVAQKLDAVDRTARAIRFDLLEAAAIQTRVMLLAEWQHKLDQAIALATTSLERFQSDNCRFLVLEVTGRQLGLDMSSKAISDCGALHHDNDIWFARRIALAKQHLGMPKDAVEELQRLAERTRSVVS